MVITCFFFSSRRRHTRCSRDWSSDVCSSDLKLMRATNGTSAEQRRLKISRRTFLRGVGVTMALPYLESISTRGQTIAPTANQFPKRLAVLFWGNGVNSNHWWAKGSGAEMELGKSLEPLAPLKTKINVISGLFNKSATGV